MARKDVTGWGLRPWFYGFGGSGVRRVLVLRVQGGGGSRTGQSAAGRPKAKSRRPSADGERAGRDVRGPGCAKL